MIMNAAGDRPHPFGSRGVMRLRSRGRCRWESCGPPLLSLGAQGGLHVRLPSVVLFKHLALGKFIFCSHSSYLHCFQFFK